MRDFIELFNKVFISVTSIDIKMFGSDTPLINFGNRQWIEFTVWANKSLNPNLEFEKSWIDASGFVCANIIGSFSKKSASTLNAHFDDWYILSEPYYDDDGRPLGGSSLVLNIPYVDSM